MKADKQSKIDAKCVEYKKAWDKLNSLLKSAKTGTTADLQKLVDISPAERIASITAIWGAVAIEKAKPILAAIETLENALRELER